MLCHPSLARAGTAAGIRSGRALASGYGELGEAWDRVERTRPLAITSCGPSDQAIAAVSTSDQYLRPMGGTPARFYFEPSANAVSRTTSRPSGFGEQMQSMRWVGSLLAAVVTLGIATFSPVTADVTGKQTAKTKPSFLSMQGTSL